MKKSSFQILLAIMLLLAACSQDELTNNTEEIQLKKGSPNVTTEISFECNSIPNGNFIEIAPGYIIPMRKILRQGTFSGTLNGIGPINSNLSTSEITFYELLPNDYLYDLYGMENRLQYLIYPYEEFMYRIVIKGKIAINAADYDSIRIEGNIYPICWYGIGGSSEAGSFEGTAMTYSGTRKLAKLNDKKFRVYSERVYFDMGNHNIGEYYLTITDNLVIK